MIGKLVDWFDHRTGFKEILHEALYERIPGGARWRYVWGSTLVFTFAVQVITGIFLWTAYSPSGQTAWESVYYIQEIMFLGNIVRGIHHYAASIMIVLLAIHLIQVIIDGAYKAPREINFWLGLILMQIVLGLSLTGYLLPWDQKGYYATQVSTKIMGATPVIGAQLQNIVQGGPEYGHHTLTRFFAMHAGILPGSLILFLGLHIYVFRRHGITVHDPKHAPETTFWPDQVLKDGVACLGVLAVVLYLAIFHGAELSPPADPAEAFAAARPEWYFWFLFRFLKFEAVEHFGLAFGAIYVPGALMTILALMPIIAMWKGGHRFNVIFMWVMTAIIFLLTGLTWYEDSNNVDHQAALAEAARDGERAKELAKRPSRIPVEGAVKLLQTDPFTQGPRLFAKHCSSCHRYNGHNGRGRLLQEPHPIERKRKVTSLPFAVDLLDFAGRKWMRAAIVDYANHFRFIRNFPEHAKGDKLNLDNSEMADMSKEYAKAFGKPENAKDLDALVEYLVAQTGRKELKIDEKLVKRGQEILDTATLADGTELSTSCVDCHDGIGSEFKFVDEGSGYPDLAQYGSVAWLKAFIRKPDSEQFYGDKNLMIGFETRMTAEERDLLVRWMVGDYHPTHVEDYDSKLEEIDAAERAAKPKKEAAKNDAAAKNNEQQAAEKKVAEPDDPDAVKALKAIATELKQDPEGFIVEVSFRGAEIDDAALDHIVGLRRVQSVLLNDTKITDKALQAVGKATTLRNVDLRGCKVSNAAISHLAGLTNLRALRLSGKNGASVDDGALSDVGKLTNLKALALDGLWVGEEGIVKLDGLKNLEEIYLGGTLVGDEALALLSQFPNLKKLRISQTQTTNAGMKHLAKLSNLEDLDLSENSQITDDGLVHLSGLSKLKKLNLWRVAVSDAGVEHLQSLTNISWLNLDNTGLTDAGLAHLKGMEKLAFLHLGSTAVSDTGLPHLENLKALKDLKVTRTSVTAEGVENLKKKLPDTVIQLRYIEGQ